MKLKRPQLEIEDILIDPIELSWWEKLRAWIKKLWS